MAKITDYPADSSITGAEEIILAQPAVGAVPGINTTIALNALAQYAGSVLSLTRDFGAVAGTDISAAFPTALSQCDSKRRPIEIQAGTYTITTAPGTIANAALHNCPAVSYPYIHLRAIGGPVTLQGVTATTPAHTGVATSRPILKADRSGLSKGTFIIEGDFIFDGAQVAQPSSLGTDAADPDACALLETHNYDVFVLGSLRYDHFYGAADMRSRVGDPSYNAAVYDHAEFRRCGMLFDADTSAGCTYYSRKSITGANWREGQLIVARFANINIQAFHFDGYSTFVSAGLSMSTPLNVHCIAATGPTNKTFSVNVMSWAGAWGGSSMNIFAAGVVTQNFYCEIVGAIGTSGTTSGSPSYAVVADPNNWGAGHDNSNEATNMVPTDAIYVNNWRGRNLPNVGCTYFRASNCKIGRLIGDFYIAKSSRAMIVSWVDYIDITLTVAGCYALTSNPVYGVALDIRNVASGRVHLKLDGGAPIQWDHDGDTATRKPRIGVLVHKCSNVIFTGDIADFEFRHVDYNQQISADSTDGDQDFICGDLRSTTSNYTVSSDAAPFWGVGRNSALRIRKAELSRVLFNGVPLVASGQLSLFTNTLMPGLETSYYGSPTVLNVPDQQIMAWGGWNGTTAGSHTPGVAVQLAYYRGSEVNGRGGYATMSTQLINGALTVATKWYENGTFATLGGSIRKLRTVTTAGAVTVAVTDHIIEISKATPAATVVNLPATPETGREYIIKDGNAAAAANNITITPAAGNIDGAATLVMATNYQSVRLMYDAGKWITL